MLTFEARKIPVVASEHGVYVTSSKGGNDAALLAVFGAPEAAEELAQFFNRLAQHFDGRFAEGRNAAYSTRIAPASAGMTD